MRLILPLLLLMTPNAFAGGSLWLCYGFKSGDLPEKPSTVLTWGSVYSAEPLTISGDAILRVLEGEVLEASVKVVENPEVVEKGLSGKIVPIKMNNSQYTFFSEFYLYQDGKLKMELRRCFQR